MYETRGDAKFYYSYDSNGILYSVKYTLTDDSELLTYYYTHNSRGDIIGIYNGSGNLKAHYEYDAWGNVLSVKDENGNAITSSTHIGNLNPFRYRGYYYDTETGLYYLMSRYYDPVTHRFLNADGYFQSGGNILDSNMSAYCRNNPISFVDPTGTHACGDPTCTICRADRRDFINNNLDWYNKITGKNVDSVNYDGTIYYKKPINIDYSSTEAKVLRTIGLFVSSFEASGDVGVGIGYSTNICKIVELGAVSKVSGYAELSGHDGIDVGIYTGNSFDASIWDIGPNYELSSSYSVITKETIPDVGSTRTISFSNSKYFGIGYSYSIGFNYGYFSDEMAELWR